MQSHGNTDHQVGCKRAFHHSNKTFPLLIAVILATSPFAAMPIDAQETYDAQKDGQWVQFRSEELNSSAPELLALLESHFSDYLVSSNGGTWGEIIRDMSGTGFYFPGVVPKPHDNVSIGSCNIQLGMDLSIREALEAGDDPLALPAMFRIGQLTIQDGRLTIRDDSQLSIQSALIHEGSVFNEGLLLLYGENGTALLQSGGSFVNNGTLVISNGNADFGVDVGYSGGGTIILDGNTVLQGKMQLDSGSEIEVSGSNNLLHAQNITVGSDGEETAQLILTGKGGGAEVQLIEQLKFDENATTRELVLSQLRAGVETESYTNIDRTIVRSGATLLGHGHGNTSFHFENGSFHGERNDSSRTFQADEIRYGDGSTIYVNIGNGDYDKITANAIRFAETDNERVNIVLFNLGNHDGRVNAHDLFSIMTPHAMEEDGDLPTGTETSGIQLGGEEIASATIQRDMVFNTAELNAENGSKITFESGQYHGQDVVTINDILVGGTSRTLGVDVTGVRFDSNASDPWDDFSASTGTHQIAGAIINNLWGTPLYNAIAANVGNDFDTFLNIAAALDPVIASVETATVQSNTMQFNRLIGNRLQASLASTVGYGGLASQSNASHVYRAQNRMSGYGNSSNHYRRMNSAFQNGLWFEGLGAYTNQDEKDAKVGFSGETFGFGVGYDRRLGRQFLLGTAFGGTYSYMRARRNMGTSKNDNYIGSLYGCYDSGPWSLSLSGGYASANIKSHRVVQGIGAADGNRKGNTWFASTEIAYRLDGKKCYLTPFYRFDFVGYHEDEYTETGQNINMAISARNDNGFLQTVGFRVGTQLTNAVDWRIIPELTAGWIHDYADGEVTTTARFVQGGPAFVLDGLTRVKERALVGLGMHVVITPNSHVFARYDGELASKYCTHTGQVGMYLYF